MTFKCVAYSVHDSDEKAQMVLLQLESLLQRTLVAYNLEDDTTQHLVQLPVRGREPACAQAGSVALFSCAEITYPSRYFRFIVTPQCRTKNYEHIPLWAQSVRPIVAFNPNADIEHIDVATKKRCFDMALLDLQRAFGGFIVPKRKRPKYASGYHARNDRMDSIGSC